MCFPCSVITLRALEEVKLYESFSQLQWLYQTKAQYCNLVLYDFHQILTIESRDIIIFVKKIPKYVTHLLLQVLPGLGVERIALRYEKAFSVSTSHLNSFTGGACSRQGAKPPAGPQNFDLLFESDHFFKRKCQKFDHFSFLAPRKSRLSEFS